MLIATKTLNFHEISMIFHNFFNPWQGSCFFIYSYALFGLLAPLYIPYMLLCALLLATVNIYMIYAYQKKKKKKKKEKKEEKEYQCL